jgi:hypothetical protein
MKSIIRVARDVRPRQGGSKEAIVYLTPAGQQFWTAAMPAIQRMEQSGGLPKYPGMTIRMDQGYLVMTGPAHEFGA